LDRLIAAQPGEWPLYHRRGRAHAALGQGDQAVADYTKAIDLGADDWQVWLDRALAHAESSRWDKAAADYARAVDMGATSAEVLNHHALLRLAVGDTKGYRRVCADLLERFGRTGNLK